MTSDDPRPAHRLGDLGTGVRNERFQAPGRVEALSDGVFAIVLTILVLEIAVPDDLSSASLRTALHELRPTFAAWIISFLIVGMYWVAHRDLFVRVKVANRDLIWINLLFLLTVSLVPFGASVLGKYPAEPLALHLYGVTVLAASVMRMGMFWYVIRRPWLCWDDAIDHRVRLGVALSAMPIPVFLLAMAVAGWSTTASRILFFSVPILYFVLITLLRDRAGTHDEADEFS